MPPQRPADAARPGREPTGDMIGPLGFNDDPEERERRLRWGPPPEDWKSYWDRKRHERDWYPEYSGPQRYNSDYYDHPRSSGIYRSQSMRERGPAITYRPSRYSHQYPERSSFERDRGMPPPRLPKDEVEEYYDSEDELTYGRRAGAGGGGRGGGRGPLPTEGSFSEPTR